MANNNITIKRFPISKTAGLEISFGANDENEHSVSAGFYARLTKYEGCQLTAEQRQAIADETAALLA